MQPNTIQVFGREDYHYMVVSASPMGTRPHAQVLYSPANCMTNQEIAAEMRRLADLVEAQ